MDHDEFIGKVQQRTDLSDRGEALDAARAVLSTLGERILSDEADDLAAQLPPELGRHLEEAEANQQFDFAEFAERVADRAEYADVEDDPERSIEAVMSVVVETVGRGEIQDVVQNLPRNEGYGELLDVEPEIDESRV